MGAQKHFLKFLKVHKLIDRYSNLVMVHFSFGLITSDMSLAIQNPKEHHFTHSNST